MSIDFSIENSDMVSGLKIISPSKFEDTRGDIWTSFNDQYTCKWNDESLGIDWLATLPILSERDSKSE